MISPLTEESEKKKKKLKGKKETKRKLKKTFPERKTFKRIGTERFVQQCEH